MTRRRCERGVTLVELLVAATIGSVVIGAVAQLLVVSSRHYARAETMAEMQAQADVALRFLRNDLRMAGHWGALRDATAIHGRAEPGDANPAGLAMPTRCTPVFTTALAHSVVLAPDPAAWGCRLSARPRSHALAVRFASADTYPPQINRLQLVGDTEAAQLTDRAQHPTAITPGAAIRDLAVRGYYVAPASSIFPDQPVLRRLTLHALASGPRYIDEEITQGIEVLRVLAHVDLDADGAADARLPAGHPALARQTASGAPQHTVHAVSVALVVRSESPRWRDAGAQQFDLLDEQLAFADDGYLRLAMIETVRVRNAASGR